MKKQKYNTYSGKLTLLLNYKDGCKIELEDSSSNLSVTTIRINPEEFLKALSGIGFVNCTFEYAQTDRIGKKMELDKFSFKVPEELMTPNSNDKIIEYARKLVEEEKGPEWVPDNYLGSQNSFTYKETSDKFHHEKWCNVTIRRWV